jgi:hypothetical protein
MSDAVKDGFAAGSDPGGRLFFARREKAARSSRSGFVDPANKLFFARELFAVLRIPSWNGSRVMTFRQTPHQAWPGLVFPQARVIQLSSFPD